MSDEDETVVHLTVCLPCRLGKRKCDGCVPCLRCIARGGADDCSKPQPKKRGRPLKPREPAPESTRATTRATTRPTRRRTEANSPVKPATPETGCVTVDAPAPLTQNDTTATTSMKQEPAPVGAVPLSTVMRLCSGQLVPSQPRDVALVQEMQMRPNFALLECPKLFDASGAYDVADSLSSSCIVAASADGTLPQWGMDARGSELVGRSLRDTMVAPLAQEPTLTWHRLTAAPNPAQPAIRTVALLQCAPLWGASGSALSLSARITCAVDSLGRLEWLYAAVEGAQIVPVNDADESFAMPSWQWGAAPDMAQMLSDEFALPIWNDIDVYDMDVW